MRIGVGILKIKPMNIITKVLIFLVDMYVKQSK